MKKDPNRESTAYASRKDVMVEEFPEGPYGASVYLDQPIGKASPWEHDQSVVSRFRDENPAFSARKTPTPDAASDANEG